VSTLLVAATGGHLSELVRLRPRLGIEDRPTWVTFDSPQARALLAGERVVHARPVDPRGYRAVVRNLPLARRLLRGGAVERVISTGSGVALSFLPLARAHGVESHYIESAARSAGPSATGRLLERVPGVRLYAQYPHWDASGWRYAGSVYDGYEPAAPRAPAGRPLRVAVALGTMPFSFRRLLDRLAAILPADAEVVLWQTGLTPLDGLAVHGLASVAPDDLAAAFAAADVVVSHAGVGSALEALDAGRRPLLVPRRARFREHVDDHQAQVAHELERRGLALWREADRIALDVLLVAARGAVAAVRDPPPIALV
jgi:UDP-N-acetylglucosamine transferase subunit ALG13